MLVKNNSRMLLFLELGHRSLQASKQQFCNSGLVLVLFWGLEGFVLVRVFLFFGGYFWPWDTCGKKNLTNSFQVLTFLSIYPYAHGKIYL